MVQYLICLVVGYFCGCISSGYFVGKLYHMDIRTQGSGNAGTTNVLRTLGKLPALITFVGDLAKAIIPIVVIRCLFDGELEYLLCLYCGFGVVLGHNFPFYLKFKGGKGIAVTSAVVMSAAHPIMIPIGIVIFATVVALTRYVSLGSLFVAWYIPANTLVFHRTDKAFVHMMVISLLFTLLAYVQHRQNIVRLIHGTENKIGAKKKEEKTDE
ncbi:MAG: glycerol-3-phosphate 1-O-acyltransferase PlsY [Lachnospiraceae bacterium]|nr:glycerol-3-phosphate 1-O-acyltransferase PlsY [Lachnospiraceae bacterium]